MARTRYYRRALLLPIVVPLVAAPIAFFTIASSSPYLAPFAWLVAACAILAFAGFYYSVPYLLAAAYLYPRLGRWSLAEQRRAVWIAPAVVSLATTLGFAGWQMWGGSLKWWDGTGAFLLMALLTGYGYAFLVALGERLSESRLVEPPEPQPPSPESRAV